MISYVRGGGDKGDPSGQGGPEEGQGRDKGDPRGQGGTSQVLKFPVINFPGLKVPVMNFPGLKFLVVNFPGLKVPSHELLKL